MKLSLLVLVLVLIPLVALINAAPVFLPNSTTSPSNSTTNPYSHCARNNTLTPENWKCYEVDKFLASWWSEHGKDCKDQPFFSCFANFYQFTYFPCDRIGTCQPGQLNDWSDSVQSYYVIVAMANLNQYFTNIYNALTSASLIINEMLPNIIDKLDPPSGGTSLKYREIINMVQAIIGAIPNPIGDEIKYIFPSFISLPIGALGAWSTYRGYVSNTQWVDFSTLSNDLATLTSDQQHITTKLLNNALYDYTNFTSFVANGSYLYGNYIGRNVSMDSFQEKFKKYLTDKMINLTLRAKKMYIVVAHDVPERAPPGQWDTKSNIWWTDPNYHLINTTNFAGKYPTFKLSAPCPPSDQYKKISNILFTNANNWTSPERVFETSLKCQQMTGRQGGGINGWDTEECLYNLAVCFRTTSLIGAGNQYVNCPTECYA